MGICGEGAFPRFGLGKRGLPSPLLSVFESSLRLIAHEIGIMLPLITLIHCLVSPSLLFFSLDGELVLKLLVEDRRQMGLRDARRHV